MQFSTGYRLSSDGQDFFTSYDEVFDSFDGMGLQENLLRGIYAYGRSYDAVFFSCFLFFGSTCYIVLLEFFPLLHHVLSLYILLCDLRGN